MAHGRPDFSSTAVDVVLRPEWAAKEGTDKKFRIYGSNKTYGLGAELEYGIPSGKTLYITGLSFSIYASGAADADLNQIGRCYLYISPLTTPKVVIGGNGGGIGLLNTPLVFKAGETLVLGVTSWANHACEIFTSAWGYEV